MNKINIILPFDLKIFIKNLNISIYEFGNKTLEGDIAELWTKDDFYLEVQDFSFNNVITEVLDRILEIIGMRAEDIYNWKGEYWFELDLSDSRTLMLDIYPLIRNKKGEYQLMNETEMEKWKNGKMKGYIAEITADIRIETGEHKWGK